MKGLATKRKNKILAAFLAVAMVFSLMPGVRLSTHATITTAKGGILKITGVNDTMKYKKADAADYTAVPSDTTEVDVTTAGKYTVCLKDDEKDTCKVIVHPGNFEYNKATYKALTAPATSAATGTAAFLGQEGADHVTDGVYAVPAVTKDIQDGDIWEFDVVRVEAVGTGGCSFDDSVKEVRIPCAIESIAEGAFKDCANLTSVVVGMDDHADGAIAIGENAFENCTNLGVLTLCKGVKPVSDNLSIIKDCENLKLIVFSGTKTEWEAKKFKIPAGVKVVCTDHCTWDPLDSESKQWQEAGWAPGVTPAEGSPEGVTYSAMPDTTRYNVKDGYKYDVVVSLDGVSGVLKSIGFDIVKNTTPADAPTGVKGGVGSITGVTDKMECCENASDTYTKVLKNLTAVTGLTNGAYKVRVAATDERVASNYVGVTVSEVSDEWEITAEGVITKYNGTTTKNVEVPKAVGDTNVTAIGDEAFLGNASVVHVKFANDSVCKSVGARAFYGCAKLTSVALPRSLEGIDFDAFDNCPALSTIDASDNTHGFSVNTGALYVKDTNNKYVLVRLPEKSATTDFTILADTITICPNAFNDCVDLTRIDFAATTPVLWNAEDGALSGEPFRGCTSLSEFACATDNTKFAVDMTNKALYTKDNNTLIKWPGATTATEFTCKCPSIGEYAFADSQNLTGISAESSVTSIGVGAFENCIGLEKLELMRSGLENILPVDMVKDDTKLQVISLPLVEMISCNFNDCKNLQLLTFAGETPDEDFWSNHGVRNDVSILDDSGWSYTNVDKTYDGKQVDDPKVKITAKNVTVSEVKYVKEGEDSEETARPTSAGNYELRVYVKVPGSDASVLGGLGEVAISKKEYPVPAVKAVNFLKGEEFGSITGVTTKMQWTQDADPTKATWTNVTEADIAVGGKFAKTSACSYSFRTALETGDEAESCSQPVATVTVYECVPNQEVKSSDGKVTVNGTLSEGAKVTTEAVTDEELASFTMINPDTQEIVGSSNITLIGGSLGKLDVILAIDEKYNGEEIIVYHKKADGTFEQFTRTVANGQVSVAVDELSPFVITRSKKIDPVPVPDEKTDTTDTTGTTGKTGVSTGDNSSSLIGVLLIALVGSVLAVFGVKMKRKKSDEE